MTSISSSCGPRVFYPQAADIGEVVNAHVSKSTEGRPDEAILKMKEATGDYLHYDG